MKCDCGYAFTLGAELADREHRSFGVVADRDWERMISLETQWLSETDPDKRRDHFDKSAELVGTLLECPRCQKLILIVNGERAVYEKVATPKSGGCSI